MDWKLLLTNLVYELKKWADVDADNMPLCPICGHSYTEEPCEQDCSFDEARKALEAT